MCVKTSFDLNHLMTTEIKELLREVESLDSENLIIINEMCDKELLKQSAGAAVHRDTKGNDIISLDPKRADEHALAHEIMHIKLHRSGWSQIYSMIPDNFARNLADKMDNLIDHHVFYPELKSTGIDISGYLDTFTVGFDYWIRSEDKELDILNNGLDACQGLLFGEPYKTRTIESIEKKYPESLKLAIELEEIITSKNINKKNIRKISVSLLDFLNGCVQKENKEVPNLRRIIGISPLFTEEELNKRASKHVHFKSERMIINHYARYLATFILKSDETRFRTYLGNDNAEPPEIFEIRRSWQTKYLKELLISQNLIYGII